MADAPSRLPAATDRRWLWKVAFSQRPWTILAALAVLSGFLCNATVPILVGRAIDSAITARSWPELWGWVLALAAVFATSATLMFAGRYLMMRSTLRVNHQLRMLVTARINDPSGIGGKQRTPGELLSIATADTARVADIIFLTVFPVAEIGSLLYVSAMVLHIHWPLGIAVLCGGPIVVAVALRAGKPLRRGSARKQQSLARTAGIATDVVQGLRVIKGLGAIAEMRRRFAVASTSTYDTTIRANRAQAGLNVVTDTVGALYVAIVGVAAGWLGLRGEITVGELIAIVGLTQFIIAPLTMLGKMVASRVAAGKASAARIVELLNAPGRKQGQLNEHQWEEIRGRIAPGLTVWAPEKLRAAGGQPTRSCPEAGELLAMLRRAPRPAVIVAPHQADLFDGTVADNVHPDRQRVLHALDVAAVNDIPGGVDRLVGEGGVWLSGGQRQRVALARAVAADPEILVLVDPTSAVDSITEQRIVEAVCQARRGKCTVVITSSPAWRSKAGERCAEG